VVARIVGRHKGGHYQEVLCGARGAVVTLEADRLTAVALRAGSIWNRPLRVVRFAGKSARAALGGDRLTAVSLCDREGATLRSEQVPARRNRWGYAASWCALTLPYETRDIPLGVALNPTGGSYGSGGGTWAGIGHW
jgi:hypothetical protein